MRLRVKSVWPRTVREAYTKQWPLMEASIGASWLIMPWLAPLVVPLQDMAFGALLVQTTLATENGKMVLLM